MAEDNIERNMISDLYHNPNYYQFIDKKAHKVVSTDQNIDNNALMIKHENKVADIIRILFTDASGNNISYAEMTSKYG